MDWTLIVCIAAAIGFSLLGKKKPEEPSEGEFELPPVEMRPMGMTRDEFLEKRAEMRRRKERIRREEEEELMMQESAYHRAKEHALPPKPQVEAASLEDIIDEIAASKQRTAPKPIKPTIRQAKTASATPPIAREEQGSRAAEIAREFDLERAVIYSELLDPKYKEYE